MPAHRCSRCALNWPNIAGYAKCPKCRVATAYMWNQESMGSVEARQLARHCEFERWLEDETPEQRADREARYAAEEVAELEALLALSGGEA